MARKRLRDRSPLEDASGLKSGSVYISGVEGGHVIGVYLIQQSVIKIFARGV